MSNDDRLTPEERAVIEAAVDCHRNGLPSFAAMYEAVRDYNASLRPQPVECLMTRRDMDTNPDGWESAYGTLDQCPENDDLEVWRVTITPIERVR